MRECSRRIAAIHNFLAGPYLDRRAEQREASDWLATARADATTRYVVARGTAHLVMRAPRPAIAFVDHLHPAVAAATLHNALLLGWYEDRRCVLVESLHSPEQDAHHLLPGDCAFEELRPLTLLLDEPEAALLAYARALTHWRMHNRYCGRCGADNTPQRAGHVMRCSNPQCSLELFPRLDPAIIVLVTDGERALLGRQASWPPGRYSTVAGFVEPGESLEDAVAREVFEETGIRVSSSAYHSSQPWPFPSSLMLGFQAVAATDEIVCNDSELEDTRWFTRADIAAGNPKLPPPTSISYRLIEHWFNAGSPRPLASFAGVGRWDQSAPR